MAPRAWWCGRLYRHDMPTCEKGVGVAERGARTVGRPAQPFGDRRLRGVDGAQHGEEPSQDLRVNVGGIALITAGEPPGHAAKSWQSNADCADHPGRAALPGMA